MPVQAQFSIDEPDNARLASLCGALDANLRTIESALDVRITRKSRLVWKFHGEATVDGQKVAEASLMCALRELNREEEAAGAVSDHGAGRPASANAALPGKPGTSRA